MVSDEILKKRMSWSRFHWSIRSRHSRFCWTVVISRSGEYEASRKVREALHPAERFEQG
jgi:hypothetical protein